MFWRAKEVIRTWRGGILRDVGDAPSPASAAVRLGSGIYTVRDACRILRPNITPRKVRYWLDQTILDEPIRWGTRGVPTLLTFHQLVRIRTLQRLRDDLGVSLAKARLALHWIADHVTADEWQHLTFFRTGVGDVGVTDGAVKMAIPAEQHVFEETLPELQRFLEETRRAWEAKSLPIQGFPLLLSDPNVHGGAPVISGTRIETAFVAHLMDDGDLTEVSETFPEVSADAIRQAAVFEGVDVSE